MSSLLTPSHPAFAISHDSARSYLTWARRLAQFEAILLLVGSCNLIGSAGGHVNPVAIALIVTAFLYLPLAYYVGQGNVRAAVTLLGLSIARAVVAFLPSETNSGMLVAPLTLADLFLFTQAVRAAISLAQSRAVNPLAVAETSDSPIPAGTFKWPRPWEVETPIEESVNPHFTLDFIVASVLLAISIGGLADATLPRGGGADALGGILGLLIFVFHLPMAVVLFASAHDSETKKFWARTPRVSVYVILGLELLNIIGLMTKIAFHTA